MPQVPATKRCDDVIAQVALNRPRTWLAYALWTTLIIFGVAAVVSMFLLSAVR